MRVIFIFLLISVACRAQVPPTKPKNTTAEEYIGQFRDIAIKEMERTGVPASIKLAQGVHESSAGNSPLAKEANNHFGIKCGSGWAGTTYYRWDDEAQESCFRVYDSALHSYKAHSDFLVERKRYDFLFEYDKTDYKNWAYGLKKAGYATDPKYPEKLIATIEKYSLHLYDLERSTILTPNTKDTVTAPITIMVTNVSRAPRTKPRSFLFREYKKGIFLQNAVPYAIAQKGESALSIAERFGIPYQKFLKFNDMIDGDLLMEYQYAYIQPKKPTYKGAESFHRVKQDETMYEISQFYGVKWNDLLLLNLMAEGQEPANGEIILLKEKAAFVPALRPAGYPEALPPASLDSSAVFTNTTVENTTVLRPEPEDLLLNKPTYDTLIYRPDTTLNTSEFKGVPSVLEINLDNPNWQDELPVVEKTDTLAQGSLFSPTADTTTKTSPVLVEPFNPFGGTAGTVKPTTVTPEITQPITTTPSTTIDTPVAVVPETTKHAVQAGETLYRIAVKYKVEVAKIKEWNNLSSDSLKQGQVLIIKK